MRKPAVAAGIIVFLFFIFLGIIKMVSTFKFEFPAACRNEVEIPTLGAAGIGILAFHLLDLVPLSAGREFHKIVTRFYFFV
jgi:hypothetical protein